MLRWRAAAITLLLGAAIGALCLGLGGRLAMRGFALATARASAFTLRGTLNVMFAGAIAGSLGGVLFLVVGRFLPASIWLRGLVFAGVCYVLATPGFRPPRPLVFADRKSTRLNSSHSQISYAVFCLKKKKKQTTNQDVLHT